mgnify:FL=1
MRKTSKLIVALVVMISFIRPCYAYVFTVPTVNDGTGGSGSSDNDGPPTGEEKWFGSGGYEYTCSYSYNITTSYRLNVNGYNQNDELIIGDASIIPTENIKAGTSIGISINEYKRIDWKVLSVSLIKKTPDTKSYYCKKTIKIPCTEISSILGFKLPFLVIQKPGKGNCPKIVTKTTTSNTPLSGWNCRLIRNNKGEEVPVTDKNDGQYQKCQTKAENTAKTAAEKYGNSPSYVVKIKNSNYIHPTDGEQEIVKELTGTGGCNTGTNSITCNFVYEPKSVCMNLKTSKVTYRDTENCAEDEIKVKNTGHWHYFVPLDAKSNDDFYLSMVNKSQSESQSGAFCKAAIDYNSNYVELIKDINYKKLTGDKAKDKSLVSNGCYLSSDITIPITQKFYNEEQEGDKLVFKGYSFYYRPIDIKNPFPNGIADDSYWTDWNKQKDKIPDLEKSFNNLTYVATNINANSVRAYNSENPYTSWNNMNINGKSKFIESGINGTKIITRYADTNSFYKLGCGPANKDWEECK